ncbi:aldolase [Polychaeton citri CBS 116435]|uniref:Transaldolase n=1 Tax=Polychaeton citri CBS 116435 TaxID=1314669 RepID=A0A9P4QBA4_9PEZI|nr:aldolase [Polychaeton citri CBS 116435]
MSSLLDTLRDRSEIDCDTLDADVAREFGPFVDCTSNQAIAFFELARQGPSETSYHHAQLFVEAISDAKTKLQNLRNGVQLEEFVVDILMIKLQLRILPHLTGSFHIQTNPKLSYSVEGTVQNAERIVAICAALAPEMDLDRICIKIPATWEGLQACRLLETERISTLATTMFCMEQAALAADAKCKYIAPYVNELKVHFVPGYVSRNQAYDFCRTAQDYYNKHSHRTQVLAASFSSVDEVVQLAGIDHITISPGLLHDLAHRDPSSFSGSLGKYSIGSPSEMAQVPQYYDALIKDQAAWRLAFTRSNFGVNEGKIIQAINYFSDFQEKLEQLVRQFHT